MPIDQNDMDHPESPYRLRSIYQAFKSANLLERLHVITPNPCSKDDVLNTHKEYLYNRMLKTESMTLDELMVASNTWYNSVYINESTFGCAMLAVGGVIDCVLSVWQGAFDNGLAMIRPPSHHAEPDQAMGFCIFNSVAIAARKLINEHGARRILIVDWDVHHGNGTQEAFYDDPEVLFVSIHRYEDGTFYPSSETANYTYVGGLNARGYNINIPWPCAGFGNFDYLHVFHKIILPIATQYKPEIVIISAGFDAAYNDPLGGNKLTFEAYAQMTHLLQSVCSKVVICLEGGYHLLDISRAVVACTKVLLGQSPPQLPDDPAKSAQDHDLNGDQFSDSDQSEGDDVDGGAENDIAAAAADNNDDDDMDEERMALLRELEELNEEEAEAEVAGESNGHHNGASESKSGNKQSIIKSRLPSRECVELCNILVPFFSQYWPALGGSVNQTPHKDSQLAVSHKGLFNGWMMHSLNQALCKDSVAFKIDCQQIDNRDFLQYGLDATQIVASRIQDNQVDKQLLVIDSYPLLNSANDSDQLAVPAGLLLLQHFLSWNDCVNGSLMLFNGFDGNLGRNSPYPQLKRPSRHVELAKRAYLLSSVSSVLRGKQHDGTANSRVTIVLPEAFLKYSLDLLNLIAELGVQFKIIVLLNKLNAFYQSIDHQSMLDQKLKQNIVFVALKQDDAHYSPSKEEEILHLSKKRKVSESMVEDYLAHHHNQNHAEDNEGVVQDTDDHESLPSVSVKTISTQNNNIVRQDINGFKVLTVDCKTISELLSAKYQDFLLEEIN
ncbi:hypothetical protein MP228_002459 [Amoeboaphelidium protococcarum]|nr:hypothetical protein MP228_002459 [Amoeboaphelidium protococcarum]